MSSSSHLRRLPLLLLKRRAFSTKQEVDLVVIGSGPGGYIAAVKAAQSGLKTVNVEKFPTLGGSCLNVGCTPTKALLSLSQHYYLVKSGEMEARGISVSGVELDLGKMMARKREAVKGVTDGVAELFRKYEVRRVTGFATITAANEVAVETCDGCVEEIRTKNIIIATGSEVAPFPGVEIDEERIVSSTGALSLKEVPRKLAIIGAGVSALELGSVWARLGSEVVAIEYSDFVGGAGIDQEVSKTIHKILLKQGLQFKFHTKMLCAERTGCGVSIVVENLKTKKTEQIDCDVLFISVGRRPFTDNLGLQCVGIERDQWGFVPVNAAFQTSVPNIFAAGDCVRGPMYAHKAEYDGVVCVEGILNGVCASETTNYWQVPRGIFTNPEVAWVGKSEEDLKKAGREYTVGRFPFAANSRAKTVRQMDGFVKVLADKQTHEVLGAHIVGLSAGELANEAVLAMEAGVTARDIARIVHAHPTASEAFREANIAASFGRSLNY